MLKTDLWSQGKVPCQPLFRRDKLLLYSKELFSLFSLLLARFPQIISFKQLFLIVVQLHAHDDF